MGSPSCRSRGWLALAVLAGAGGAVGGLAPVGIGFPAVAVIAAATLVGALPTGAIAVIAAASLTTTVLVAGGPHAIIAEGLLAIAAAVLGGASRRQYQDRAAQAEQLLADAERDRAAALAERNPIGREVHDVLAHSLGALCVQLDAADALLDTGGDRAKARELVRRARRLAVAVDGLGETRPLDSRLGRAARRRCQNKTEGMRWRALTPDLDPS